MTPEEDKKRGPQLGFETMRLKVGGTTTVRILYECLAADLQSIRHLPGWEYLADYQEERNRYPWERGRVVNGDWERIYCWAPGGG